MLASTQHVWLMTLLLGCSRAPIGAPGPSQDPAAPVPSTRYAAPEAMGRLPVEVAEASGLAVFHGESPVLWLHNDSGDLAHLYALDGRGRLLTTVLLDGLVAIDWEDLSRGPCSREDAQWQCLYIGDIGDNYRMREHLEIHRLKAPATGEPFVRLQGGIETMRMAYPDGPRDAEALVVDETGRVFILSKERNRTTGLYSVAFAPSDQVVIAERHGVVDLSFLPETDSALVTAADYNPVERLLLLRTYDGAIECQLDPDRTLSSVRRCDFAKVPTVEEQQGESIAYGVDGYWHVSEGVQPPLYFVARHE